MRALVLDLDFTLLHLEWLPDSLEVPGRTRSAWIAPQTIELLRELQTRFAIVLATARSWDGTHWVCDGFAARGLNVEGVVLEDGARLGSPNTLRPFVPSFDIEAMRARVEQEKPSDCPPFEWQLDFQSCLVARCDASEDAAKVSLIFAKRYAESDTRVFRDGRKVYILPHHANKWNALQALLGERAPIAAGVGDGANDLVWLPQVAFPATFARSSAELKDAVQARGGFVCQADGHGGIAEILRAISLTA